MDSLNPLYTGNALQPRNYQVSKEIVHDLEFGDIVMHILTDTNFNTHWQFETLKRGKDNRHDTWKM